MFYYIRDTFTTPKTKDLVEIQTKKYKSIVEELLAMKSRVAPPPTPFLDIVDTTSEAETVVDYDHMASELQDFVASL